MGLNIFVAEDILKLKKNKKIKNDFNVIDIGAQDLFFDEDDLKNLLTGKVNTDAKLPDKPQSAYKFYRAIGCKNYDCIDINGKHNAYKFDLNFDIQEKYSFHKKYDFIYNGGTSEHCFNQYMVFKNIHNLCALNGLMYHVLPIQGGVNHGFFNYHPIFFSYLANVNFYKIEDIYFFTPTEKIVPYTISNFEYILKNFSLNFDENSNIMIHVIYKKQKDNIFNFPYQVDSIDENKLLFSSFSKNCYIKYFSLENIKKVAIFGCGKAAQIALKLCDKVDIEVICNIDDFKKEDDTFSNIVDRKTFTKYYAKKVDAILFGPFQKGDHNKELPDDIKKITIKIL